MFKKLAIIGLAIAITLLVISTAMADLKFYGGDMSADVAIRPRQGLNVPQDFWKDVAQGLTFGDSMAISTTEMYGVVADNEFLVRNVSGSIDKGIFEKQVTATTKNMHANAYKNSGLQTTVGSFGVTSSDNVILNGNNGNIQFDAAGADPTLMLTAVDQNNGDSSPGNPRPFMLQTNDETAILETPGTSADTPLSLITTGDATGLVTIGSAITSATAQDQEFSSLLTGCAGLYNGQMQKIDSINMSSTHQIGTIQ